MSCLQTWEREVVSLAAYLVTIRDSIMVMVYQHLRLWVEKSSFSLLPSANKILHEAGSEVVFPKTHSWAGRRSFVNFRRHRWHSSS